MTASDSRSSRRSQAGRPGGTVGTALRLARRIVPWLVVLIAVSAVCFFAASGLAADAYTRSRDTHESLRARVAEAQTARRLAPWNRTYATHEFVMVYWLAGKQLLEAGDYADAVSVLDAAYRLDVGNEELLALNKRSQEIQAIATNRKAHLQHGHEGVDNSLRPQDVER